jgi:hypothetical protein
MKHADWHGQDRTSASCMLSRCQPTKYLSFSSWRDHLKDYVTDDMLNYNFFLCVYCLVLPCLGLEMDQSPVP